MKNTDNVGIIAAISWNSNHWKKTATKTDIDNSNFAYVKENGWMHEDLNFAHEILPCEEDGTYVAYTPMFNNMPAPHESQNVEIVFFRSLNYHSNKQFIVGFYAHPYIDRYDRLVEHKLYEKYDWGNVAAAPEHIVYFKNAVEISNEIVLTTNFLPKGKKIGQQGFNYIHYDNVLKILDKATELNPEDNKLKKIKFGFITDKFYKGF